MKDVGRDPQYYEMMDAITESLERHSVKVDKRFDDLEHRQAEIAHKLAMWESNAAFVKYVVVGFAGLITSAAAAYEWAKEHIK